MSASSSWAPSPSPLRAGGEDAPSVRRRLATSVGWMLAGSWGEQAINVALSLLIARLLGAEVFGLATLALIPVILSELLVRETLTEAVIQEQDLDAGHLDALFWTLGGLSILLTGILVLAAEPIAALFSAPQVRPLIQVGALCILSIGWSGVPVTRLRREMRFGVMASRALVGVVAGGAIGVGMALAGLGAWALIGQRLALTLANDLVAWRAAPWRPRGRAGRAHFREIWTFGSRTVGLRSCEIVSRQTPHLIVGYVLGPTALGWFFMAWRIVELLSFLIVSPVRYAAQSAFSAMRRYADSAQTLLFEISEAVAVISFACFLGLAVVAGPAVTTALGPGWSGAAPAVAALSLVGIFLSLERIQQAYCLAMGIAGPLATLSLAEALLGVVAAAFAVSYGIAAVGLAMGLRYLLLWPFRLGIMVRYTGIDAWRYLGVFVRPLAVALAMALGVRALLGASGLAGAAALVRLLAGTLCGVVLYGAGALLFLRPQLARLALFARPARAA